MSMALLLLMMLSSAERATNASMFPIMGWLLLAAGPVFVSLIFVGKTLINLFSRPFHPKKLLGLVVPVVFMAIYLFPVNVDNEELIAPLLFISVSFSAVYSVTGLVMSAMALHNRHNSLTEE